MCWTSAAADRRISSWQVGAGNSSWSPDGSQIAFNSEGGHSANLYVIHADGSRLKELLAAGHGRDGRAALDREPVASLCRR